MQYLPKGEFFKTLERRYPYESASYFYDGRCSRLAHRKIYDASPMVLRERSRYAAMQTEELKYVVLPQRRTEVPERVAVLM